MFIWVDENLGTFASAWINQSQQTGWRPVSILKLGAWYPLMLVSFAPVAGLGSAEAKPGVGRKQDD